MRLLLALILTILNSLGFVLSVDPNLQPLLIHILRQPNPPGSSNSSVSSTSTSTSTTPIVSPSTTSSAFSPSTSTSISTSSSQTSSSSTSFSTSSSSTSTQQFSTSSQPQSSTFSSQSTEFSSFTSSSSISDTPSTGISSPTAFTSTGLAGSLTVTAVVSGPSGGSGLGNIGTAKQGFFANTGAVAGTFLVVGLVGTGILICALLWALRRYHRRKRDKVYFDEYREFNQTPDRGATSDVTPPVTHDHALDIPVPSSSAPNMIERLHGSEALFNAYPARYRAQPGEFDPYQDHGGAYAYIDDPENGQQGAMAFAYQPEMGSNRTTDYQTTTGLLHAPEAAVNAPHQDHLNNQGPPTN